MNIRQVVPRYKFDLDRPPKDRWLPLLFDYREKLKRIEPTLNEMLNEIYGSRMLTFLFKHATKIQNELCHVF